MAKTISEQLSDKTLKELAEAEKLKARSRTWKNPQGYRFLIQWSNLVLLRILVRKFTETLPKSEYRTKTQADDAARSNVANLEEGWKRPTTKEYLTFLGFTQASLEEVKGDVERWLQDGFIASVPKSQLSNLGIDLKAWSLWVQNPLNSFRILYFPLKSSKGFYRTLEDLKGNELTYEVFIELINKTDWLLRRLVLSLEQKLEDYKLELGGIRK